MIDPAKDELMTLERASKHPLMKNHAANKPVHVCTMVRRVVDGVGARDGTVIKLEAVRTADGFFTTEAAIQQFHKQLQEHSFSRCPSRGKRIPSLRRAERETAKI